MKTLDFDSRTRVARDSIRLVCTEVGITLRDRRKVRKKLFFFDEYLYIPLISLMHHQLVNQ
jgi:hypothetical protein